MPNTDRIATLEARLTKISAAIDGTLDRGVLAYSIAGRSLSSFTPDQLRKLEADTMAELSRLRRVAGGGSRFGKIGFRGVTA